MTAVTEPSFNAYDFERFYHDYRFEEPTLPSDYVPDYWWLDDAVAVIKARMLFNSRYKEDVFVRAFSLSSTKSKVTFVTQEPESPIILAICALRSLEEAKDGFKSDSYSWSDVEPYLRRMKSVMNEIEAAKKPQAKSPLRILKEAFRK